MNLKINSLRFFIILFTAFIVQGNLIAQYNSLNSQLIEASQVGDFSKVQDLIEKGAIVNAKSKSECTALMYSAEHGHEKVAELLIEKGADINARDWRGRTALVNAVWAEDEEMVKLLIEKGANVNAKDNDGETALMWAVRNGFQIIAELLIEKGANVNAKTNSGWTALMYSAERGHEKIAKLLIEKGVDVNVKNKSGWIALMYSAERGHEKIVKLLIEKGANVNAKDNDVETALMWAVIKGYEKVAKLLIEKGANVNVKSIDTIIDWLYLYKRCEEIEKLLKLLKSIIEVESNPLTFEKQSGEVKNILIKRWLNSKRLDILQYLIDNNCLNLNGIKIIIKKAIEQLDNGNKQIYNILPVEYQKVVNIFMDLLSGNKRIDQIKSELKEKIQQKYNKNVSFTSLINFFLGKIYKRKAKKLRKKEANDLLLYSLRTIYDLAKVYKENIPVATEHFLNYS